MTEAAKAVAVAPPPGHKVPITRPLFGPEELAALQRPLGSGWVVQGPEVREFERRFATFAGAPHAVAASSCTTALHMAVAALGLGPGREVLVPAFTWVSTANVVEYQGATPVFCDVELDSFNVDPAQVEERATPRTAGILPVHLFGLAADMDAIGAVARRASLWVVEDAACGFGACFRDRHVGTLGDAGCFSFHPRKAITTGEGGMLTTARPEVAEKARSLRDHGADLTDHARHGAAYAFRLAAFPNLGYNYRMTDLQASLGNAQMGRADHILRRRAALAARYGDLLASLPWLRPPQPPRHGAHGWQAYVALFAPERPTLANVDRLGARRDRLMRAMEERGIATRQGTHAAALTAYYAAKYGHRRDHFPNAALAEALTITLPLFPQMTDAEQDLVVHELRRAHAEA